MHELRSLQRDFGAYLMGGEGEAVAGRVEDTRITALQCLSIHRNNFTITLRESLATVYPVVKQLVGDDFFADLARKFLLSHPCRSGNLHDFGREFDAFLARDERLANLRYMPDVAALEWAFHESFHGPDAGPLDIAKLQRWSAEEFSTLRFVVHPGSRLLCSDFPVLAIWEAHQEGHERDTVDLDAGAEYVLVVRPQLDVELHRLARADYAFLDSLRNDATLEQATEAGIAHDESFDLEGRLMAFVSGGVIVDVRA